MLCAHPDCAARPEAKELHFFDRFWGQSFGETAIVEYHALFAADPTKRIGEWTPRYLFDPWTPPLLRAAAPDARLIVMLRDPVGRFQSQVTRRLLERSWLPYPLVAGDAFARSTYGAQLARLHRSFDPDQVLVLQYERCVANPTEQLARTYEFCGLDDDVVPTGIEERVGWISREPMFVPEATIDALAGAYADDLCLLARLVPDLDLQLWPTAIRLGIA